MAGPVLYNKELAKLKLSCPLLYDPVWDINRESNNYITAETSTLKKQEEHDRL